MPVVSSASELREVAVFAIVIFVAATLSPLIGPEA